MLNLPSLCFGFAKIDFVVVMDSSVVTVTFDFAVDPFSVTYLHH